MKHFLFGLLILSFATAQAAFDLGEVQIQVLGSGSHIETGQYAEVGKFRVQNRTGRNLVFDSLRLRNYGSADLDESFESPVITTTTNEILGNMSSASSKYWTFGFPDNIELRRGDSMILSVKARLTYAKRGETVQLGFRRLEDLDIRDKSSGFGVRCENCEGSRLKTYSLDPGGVTLTRTNNYGGVYRGSSRYFRGAQYDQEFSQTRVLRTNYYRPTTSRYIATPRTSQQYSPGARDVVFFSSRVSSRQGVAVDGLFLSVAGGSQSESTINDSFGDWRLLINGVTEDTSNEVESYRGRTGVLFSSSMEIPPNAQIVMVGRVKNSAKTGDRVRFSLDSSGLIDPEYLSSRQNVRINGTQTGNYSETR